MCKLQLRSRENLFYNSFKKCLYEKKLFSKTNLLKILKITYNIKKNHF